MDVYECWRHFFICRAQKKDNQAPDYLDEVLEQRKLELLESNPAASWNSADNEKLHDFAPTTRITSERRQMQLLDIQQNIYDEKQTLPVKIDRFQDFSILLCS